MNLGDDIKELAGRLPDERWFNLSDYDELVELRASLDAVGSELRQVLERWS